MSTPQRPSTNGPDDERGLSGLQRAMLVLVGLAALLLAFVIFQAAGDEGGDSASERTTAAQTATATTNADTTGAETGTTTGETGTTTGETETGETQTGETETGETGTTQTRSAAPTVPTIRVVDGQPQGGVRTLSFDKGERIRFRVRSNAADEVHVHGYDVTKAVPAGGSALLSFEATIEGRFEVELHEAGTQLAELEVAPA